MTSSLEEALDRLYQQPLDEFVRARNALAKSLKDEGDVEGSKRVKGLAKPSASAWAVNQLYFRAREVFDRLIETGDLCRRAQSELLGGGESEALASAEADRDEAVEKARRRVVFILSEARVASGPAILRRVSTTLEAVASFGSKNPEPWNGRASEDLDPPGFRALSGLAVVESAKPALPSPGAAPPLDQEQTARAKARLREAERKHSAARTARDVARTAAEALRKERQALVERLAHLESALGAAESEVERAEAELRQKETELVAAIQESGGDGAS